MTDVREVRISDGRGRALTLRLLPSTDGGDLLVCYEAPGLVASLRVWQLQGSSELAQFVTGLATEWRGWSGSRTFVSTEGDFTIAAVHDGRVQLRISLRSSHQSPDSWVVEGDLDLDPGAQLDRFADDLRVLAT